MGESIKRVFRKFKDIVETYGARALLASLLVIASTCVGSVATLMKLDGETTVKACASMAFYGFCIGWLFKWIEIEKLPLRRLRKTVDSLPRNQRAVLIAAHGKNGAFRQLSESAATRVEDDVLALESLGLITRVEDGMRPLWSLSVDARRLLDKSECLRLELEKDRTAWTAEVEALEHQSLLDAAKSDLLGLDQFGAMTVGNLLTLDGPMRVEEYKKDDIVRHVGSNLLDMKRTVDGGFLLSVSPIAREAAPLVFADE